MEYTNEEMLEAIEVLESAKQHGCRVRDDAIDIAEQAINKQIPKKPSTGTNITIYDNWTLLPLICPCCGRQVGTIEAYTKLRDIKEHFCSKCGQAIDWSKT